MEASPRDLARVPVRQPPRDPAIEAASLLARWMDGRFLDPLLGLLLPGVGDFLSSALGVYPVILAWRRRAPRALLARMLLNLAADALGGAVPLVGDLWDFIFRAHTRNLDLLRSRAADGEIQSRRSDTLIIVAAVLACLAALAVPVLVVVGILYLIVGRR